MIENESIWIGCSRFLLLTHFLEQHVKRVCAETRRRFDTHVNSEFLLPEPFADSWQIVLVQESHVIRLQGMVQVYCHIPVELTILLEHEGGKRSIAPVLLLLEKYFGAIVVVRFHCFFV